MNRLRSIVNNLSSLRLQDPVLKFPTVATVTIYPAAVYSDGAQPVVCVHGVTNGLWHCTIYGSGGEIEKLCSMEVPRGRDEILPFIESHTMTM